MKYFLSVFIVLLVSSGAHAQTSAKASLQCGIEAARASEWDEAVDCFEEAYRLSNKPAILLNIGASQTELGLFVEAIRSYERYLKEAPSGEFKETAQKAIKTLDARVGYVTFDYKRAPDEIVVDGTIVTTDKTRVNPGAHEVEARWGTQRTLTEFSVKEGEETSARLFVPPSPRETAMNNTVSTTETTSPPVPVKKKSKAGLAIGITVGVLVVVGVVLAIILTRPTEDLNTNGGVIEVN